jgi:hypothetical protein
MAIKDKIISFWKQVKLKSSDMFTLFRVGIGVKVPTHKLHVKDTTDPLKVEGLQNDTTDPDKYLTIDSNNIVKYRTGTEVASDIGVVSSFILEDGDGTEVTVTNGSEIKFVETAGIDIDWTDVSDGSDSDPYDLTFTVNPAQTTITSLFATDIKIGEDDETKVDFETANEIHFDCNNAEVMSIAENQIDITAQAINVTSSGLGDPSLTLKTTANADHGSASIIFDKDRGAAAADGQVIGVILFRAEDDAENQESYARILGQISDASHGSEGGQLELEIASHDGELVCGLKLVDGDAEDEVDVTIANTTTSLTTIAGDVQVNGNDIKDDDGVSCITFDSSGNTTVANTLNATLTGNVTGNVSGSSGSATGNAATATALETGRTINGVSFDGTGNITVTAAGTTLSDTVPVSKGGTGVTSIAADTIITGNGTGALTSEAYLTYNTSDEEMIIGNPDTGDAKISRRANSGTDAAGGKLIISAGAATGDAAGGSIEFHSSVAGSSGSSVQSTAEVATISKEGNLSIDGDLTVKGNDIKDDDGTTCITFDSSGNTTIAGTTSGTFSGNLSGNASGLSATLAVGSGGTGATTLSSNAVLTGNGTSAIQAESSLSYSSETLTIGDNDNGTTSILRRDNSSGGGGGITIKAGSATGTDVSGGHLALYGGGGTGTGVSGLIRFYGHGAGSSGSSAGTFGEIAQLDGTGNLQIDGTLIGKVYQTYPMNFYDDIGTTLHYLSWQDQYEYSSNSYTDIDIRMMAPANGRVVSVSMRMNAVTNAATRTVTVYSTAPDYGAATISEESEAIAIDATDDYHAFNFVFSNAEHFDAGDLINIGVQDDTDMGSAQNCYVTVLIEWDYNNLISASSDELP